jgi:nitrite reductase/ring-hydroxylating ferredoxin subunit
VSRTVVCRTDDLPVGSMREVMVEGRSVLLVRSAEDRFYALRNVCPHQGAPLHRGVLDGTNLPSAWREFHWGRDREIVRCPWHHYEYDAATGRSLAEPDRLRMATYAVVVEQDQVMVVT